MCFSHASGSLARVATIALVCVLALSSGARGQDTTWVGNEHATKGQKLFVAGRYAEAIDELRAGLVATGQPRFLYALGQAYRMNHQCVDAVKAYRDFLRANPSRAQAADTEGRIKLCGAEDPSSTAPPPAPVAAVPVIEAPPTPIAPTPSDSAVIVAAPPKPHTPVYERWWLWTTVGVVAVGLGVGLGVGLTRPTRFHPVVPPFGPGQ